MAKNAITQTVEGYKPAPILGDIIELERKRITGFMKAFKAGNYAMMKKYKINNSKAAELQEFIGMDDYEGFSDNEIKYCQHLYKLWIRLEQKHNIDEVDEYTFTFWPTIGKDLWWMEFDSDGKLTDIGNDTYVKQRVVFALERERLTQGEKIVKGHDKARHTRNTKHR